MVNAPESCRSHERGSEGMIWGTERATWDTERDTAKVADKEEASKPHSKHSKGWQSLGTEGTGSQQVSLSRAET